MNVKVRSEPMRFFPLREHVARLAEHSSSPQ